MKEFRVCTTCGYERGFHVCFRENENGLTIGLICPSCGQSFDIQWQEKDIRAAFTPQAGAVYDK